MAARCFEFREPDVRVDFLVMGFMSTSESEFFDSEFLDSEFFDSEFFGAFLVPFFSTNAFFDGGESIPVDSESEPLLLDYKMTTN